MTTICAVSKDRYLDKGWKPSTDFSSVANETLVLLMPSEVSAAALKIPIGLAARGTGYQLVGVMGIDPKSNLQVSPQGKWRGAYLPKMYRQRPFLLAGTTDGNRALCIDESAAEICARGEGNDFFTETGETSPKVTETLQALVEIEREKVLMQAICALLQELGLIEPWDLALSMDNKQKKMQGLFRIKETRLNELTGDQLERMRNTSALAVAYCQLLSMQNMQALAVLHIERQRAALEGGRNLQEMGVSVSNELISFDNL